jgi:hypothetical protein
MRRASSAEPDYLLIFLDKNKLRLMAQGAFFAAPFDQSLHGSQHVLRPNEPHAVFGTQRTAPAAVRTTGTAGQVFLQDYSVA